MNIKTLMKKNLSYGMDFVEYVPMKEIKAVLMMQVILVGIQIIRDIPWKQLELTYLRQLRI